MTTGKRIAQKRKELHMTQEDFGEQMGVSRQSVYRWEQDATMPEIDTLLQMSRVFGVSLDWLLCKEEQNEPEALTDTPLPAAQPSPKGSKFLLRLVSAAMAVVMLVSLILMGAQIISLKKDVQALKDLLHQQKDPTLPEDLYSEIAADPGQITKEYLPVIFIEVSEGAWGDKKDIREGTLYWYGADGTNYEFGLTIKPQGSSSLAYDKKNFTIKLDDTIVIKEYWGEQSEFCLKANYIDPTHAGNVVSARLAGQMNKAYGVLNNAPNGGSIDGIPVWVNINGEPIGMYTWCIPKAAWMFGMDERNSNHFVMCGESWSDGGRFVSDTYARHEDWSVEVGDEDAAFAAFDRLYAFIQGSTDQEFKENISDYLDLDACLNYYCFAAIANAQDNMAKNMLLATYDGLVWAPALYDLDSLWGIDSDGLTTDWTELAAGIFQIDDPFWLKLRTCFDNELKARYAELRDDILSEENIWATFEAFIDSIPDPYYMYDTAMWNPKGEMIRTLDLMRQCVAQYLPQVDALMGYIKAK